MELLFLIIIIIMLGLAIFDLVVGVSNDASNFLHRMHLIISEE